METNTWERKGSNTTYVWMLRGKEGEWVKRGRVTLFGYFLRKKGEGFGGVWITSDPLFLIPKNWRDLEEEWSIKIFDQMNYQIYLYYISKITNEKTNYFPLLLNFKNIQIRWRIIILFYSPLHYSHSIYSILPFSLLKLPNIA